MDRRSAHAEPTPFRPYSRGGHAGSRIDCRTFTDRRFHLLVPEPVRLRHDELRRIRLVLID